MSDDSFGQKVLKRTRSEDNKLINLQLIRRVQQLVSFKIISLDQLSSFDHWTIVEEQRARKLHHTPPAVKSYSVTDSKV